jgi:DNA-binding MarR family transcriptional regulator
MDDTQERLGLALLKLYEMDFLRVFADFYQGELHSLQHLALSPNRAAYPSELSVALGITRARVTSILAGLRRKGYVTMTPCEEDRRRQRVEITEAGLAYVAARQAEVFRLFGKWVAGMGEVDAREMIRLIELTAKIMR